MSKRDQTLDQYRQKTGQQTLSRVITLHTANVENKSEKILLLIIVYYIIIKRTLIKRRNAITLQLQPPPPECV